jgi:hypothetical protein
MKIHGTAKGAALSTKDFGVAFGGGVPCNQKWIGTPEGGWADVPLTAVTEARVEKFTESGMTSFDVCKFSAYLKKTDTLNDTVYSKIWNSSGTIVSTSDDTYVNADVSTDFGWFEFEFDNITLAEDYWIGVWYAGNNLAAQKSVTSGGEPTSLVAAGMHYDSGSWGGENAGHCYRYIVYSFN